MQNSSFSAVLFGLLLICAAFISCNKCRKIDCQNGDCLKGECICEDGYKGDRCENAFRDLVTGNFHVFNICNSGIGPQYDIVIEPLGSSPWTFEFVNFNQTGENIRAEFSDSVNFSIPSQSYLNGTISGEGSKTFNSDTLDISYSVTDSSGTDECASEIYRK